MDSLDYFKWAEEQERDPRYGGGGKEISGISFRGPHFGRNATEYENQEYKLWLMANEQRPCPNEACGGAASIVEATDVNPNLVTWCRDAQWDITDPENPVKIEGSIYRCPHCLCFLLKQDIIVIFVCWDFRWILGCTKQEYDDYNASKGHPVEPATGPTGGDPQDYAEIPKEDE